MRIRFDKYNPGSSVHMIWGAIALLVIVTAGLYRDLIGLMPACVFHGITGIPCLTCGATRSVVSLSTFDLTSSFLLNPLLVIFIIGIIIFSSLHLAGFVFKRKLNLELTPQEKKGIRIAVIALIALNWIYLVIAGV
ncbi:MAG: DUF2752 domain-containing protein [candidate division Zixibacteria bacterium]